MRRSAYLLALLMLVPDGHADPGEPADAPRLRLGTTRLRCDEPILAVAFAPDGRSVATLTRFSGLSLWDCETGDARWSIPTTGTRGGYLAFSADGRWLACSGENEVRILFARSGVTRAEWQTTDPVAGITFTPDGKLLAAAYAHGSVGLWDLSAARERTCWPRTGRRLTALAAGPDGSTLALGAHDGTVEVWDLAGCRRLRAVQAGWPVQAVAFAPDGTRLAAISAHQGMKLERAVRVWDSEGRPFADYPNLPADVVALKLLSDGLAAATAGRDGLRFFDAATRRPLGTPPGPCICVDDTAVSADGRICARVRDRHTLQLRDTATGRDLHPTDGHTGPLADLVFSTDGGTVITTAEDDTARVWDARTGVCRRTWHLPHPDSDGPVGAQALALAPDGRTAALGTDEDKVFVWDVAGGRLHDTLTAPENWSTHCLAFAPDGSALAAGSSGGPVLVWPLNGDPRRDLPGLGCGVSAVAFSPDGKTLAAAGNHGVIRVWDVASTQLVVRPIDTGEPLLALRFTPSGRELAWASADHHWGLIDAATGRELRRVMLHDRGRRMPQPTSSMSFSADLRMLATTDFRAGTLRLWELASGGQRRLITGPSTSVNALALSPDGRRVAIGSDDTTAVVWDVAPPTTATPADFPHLWNDLADADAMIAFGAVTAFATSGSAGADWLGSHLAPATAPSPERLTRLLADLGHPRAADRDRAARDLADLGEQAAPRLRQFLDDSPPPEARRRAERLLDRLDRWWDIPDEIRRVRAVEALERNGSPQAKRVLERLAGGVTEARLTREAKAALGRMR